MHVVKSIVACFLFVFTYSGNASILRVPRDYATIQLANQAASQGDTVLLERGNYFESALITHDLLITSQWLFSRDTNDRDQTILSPLQLDSTSMFITATNTLEFKGVTFRSAQPHRRVRIISSPNTILRLLMYECVIDGGIDTTRNVSSGLIFCNIQPSSFIGERIQFRGIENEGVPLLSIRGKMSLFNSTFYNHLRDDVTGIFFASGISDSLSISDCSFNRIARGIYYSGSNIQIRRNCFQSTGEWSLNLSAPGDNNLIIDSCKFDSCFSSQQYQQAVITFSSTTSQNPTISNCQFTNANSTGGAALIESHERVFIRNCIFRNNSGFIALISSNTPFVEGCQFLDNGSFVFMDGYNGSRTITVANSDFLTTSNFFVTRPNGRQFDTAFAQDNYWGDPTGPRHPQNPGGLGTILPGWVNPFPFLTEPNFPETFTIDLHRYTYSLPNSIVLNAPYPNPFNNETVIRFSLPRGTDVAVAVYDVTGREVVSLANGWLPAGENVLRWSPTLLSSGSYYVRLSTPTRQVTRTLTYLK